MSRILSLAGHALAETYSVLTRLLRVRLEQERIDRNETLAPRLFPVVQTLRKR
jgi:hypothetical protein